MSARSCVVSGAPVAGLWVESQFGIGIRSVRPPLCISARAASEIRPKVHPAAFASPPGTLVIRAPGVADEDRHGLGAECGLKEQVSCAGLSVRGRRARSLRIALSR